MPGKAKRRDYYQILGIIPTATADQIRSAFHRFAKDHHPDNFLGSPEEADHQTMLYQLGSEAYRVLLDPGKRRLYDEGLKEGKVRYREDRIRETKRSMRPPGGVMVRSSKARTFLTRAHRAIKSEDWAQAKLNLRMALQHEPENAELTAKLAEVEAQAKSR